MIEKDAIFFEPAEEEIMPDSTYVIQNSTHHCGFFKTLEEASAHLEYCQGRREEKSVASLYGQSSLICKICNRKDLPADGKPFRASFPYGTPDGMINEKIIVIQYLDYV